MPFWVTADAAEVNASGSLCLVDMGIVDVRRPFLSALLLTAGLAVAALIAASPLASWWQKRDEQRTAATFERENPALVA